MDYPAQLWLFWLLLAGGSISLFSSIKKWRASLTAFACCFSLEIAWLYWYFKLPILLEGFSLIFLLSSLFAINLLLAFFLVILGTIFRFHRLSVWSAVLGCLFAGITYTVLLFQDDWWTAGMPIPQKGRTYAQATLQPWQDNPSNLPWSQLVVGRPFIESKIRIADYTGKTERGLSASSPWYVGFDVSYGSGTQATASFQLVNPRQIVLRQFELRSYFQAFPNPILGHVESTARAWLNNPSSAPWAWALEWLPSKPKLLRITKAEQKDSKVVIEYALSDGSTLTWAQEPRTIVIVVSNPKILEQFCPPPGRWIGRCF